MLNPKWLQGMTENGYSGAGMMAEVVRNTSGWEATRKGAVSQELWAEIHAVYVKDKHGLRLREWMDRVNPHARQEILATLLEAARKGYWAADAATRRELAREYAASVAEHGDSAGLATGGNEKLRTEVAKLLTAPGDADLAALAGAYQAAVAASARPPAGSSASSAAAPADTPEVVSGNEMTSTSAPATGATTRPWVAAGVGGAAVFLVLVGAFRRRRVA
jgi:cobaltochelatase CobN